MKAQRFKFGTGDDQDQREVPDTVQAQFFDTRLYEWFPKGIKQFFQLGKGAIIPLANENILNIVVDPACSVPDEDEWLRQARGFQVLKPMRQASKS